MPYRRTYRRTPWKKGRKSTKAIVPRKRIYKRRYPLYRPRLPPLGGYGNRKLVRLRYVHSVSLDPGLGGLATGFFKCNGMVSPVSGTTTHQPRGFDEAMLAYEHFTVIGSKIKVTLVPLTTGQVQDTQTPFIWGVGITPTAALGGGVTNVDEMLETRQAGSIHRLAGSNQVYGSGRNAPTIVRHFSARKFFGKSSLVGQGQFSGTSTVDPNELAFFALWGGPIGGGAVNPDAQNFLVEIDYLAVLSERKAQPQS